ncbi:hypothetical protein EN816_00700 [Mesorhizobium sp. M8A.F.Ca.ET.173.01.1.1]|nr:hypothetical protein EN816_00700 [Mesorhizobium sp. M8A.F.Ca.ET.173.01.1.1]
MSDIPEDIDLIATAIVRTSYTNEQDGDWELYSAIARAILAERERATSILSGVADVLAKHMTDLATPELLQALADAICNPHSVTASSQATEQTGEAETPPSASPVDQAGDA